MASHHINLYNVMMRCGSLAKAFDVADYSTMVAATKKPDHIDVICLLEHGCDNQHLFGVLESLSLLSFSRHGGAAGGALGPLILRIKRVEVTSDFGPGENVKIDSNTPLQRNALPGFPGE